MIPALWSLIIGHWYKLIIASSWPSWKSFVKRQRRRRLPGELNHGFAKMWRNTKWRKGVWWIFLSTSKKRWIYFPPHLGPVRSLPLRPPAHRIRSPCRRRWNFCQCPPDDARFFLLFVTIINGFYWDFILDRRLRKWQISHQEAC